MIVADLHCHSTASDGQLSPEALVERAEQANVELFAITDHDTLAGYLDVAEHYNGPMQLISGIELSSQCLGISMHIVGLNVNVNDVLFQQRLAEQLNSRKERALQIAQKLEKLGLKGVVNFVSDNDERPVSRPDIAHYLVETNQVPSIKRAFDRYLGAGKPGDVKQFWPELDKIVGWIKDAGGVAIIAHPESYSITRTKLRRIIEVFVEAGGDALELPHEAQTADFTRYVAKLCKDYNLQVSVGSDFHSDKQPWRQLGRVPAIPEGVSPVWEGFVQ